MENKKTSRNHLILAIIGIVVAFGLGILVDHGLIAGDQKEQIDNAIDQATPILEELFDDIQSESTATSDNTAEDLQTLLYDTPQTEMYYKQPILPYKRVSDTPRSTPPGPGMQFSR